MMFRYRTPAKINTNRLYLHMTEWKVDVEDSLVKILAESIQQGPIIEIVNGSGRHLIIEKTVARWNGLKVEIFAKEDPPPHFRVKYQNSKTNFRISDCFLMNGSGQILKFEKNIFLWWKDNKQELIDTWNEFRPSDYPVGDYIEK